MKTMTCRQLGGACDKEFHADTFEAIAEMSKSHGIEMFKINDKPHLEAMGKMKELVKTPEDFGMWLEKKSQIFDSLPDNK